MLKIVSRIFYKFSSLKPESKAVGHMAEKIDLMNKTMSETSPKIFSIFMIATTIPIFYFGHKLITEKYNSKEFVLSANAGLTFINVKNIFTYACIFTLAKFKFNSPTAKHTVSKQGLIGRIAPLVLNMIALSLPPSDSPWIVFPTFIADVSTLVLEAQMANFGVYPFWLYSYRHYIRFFDWLFIGITLFALKNYRKRIDSHAHQFIKSPSQPNKSLMANDNP